MVKFRHMANTFRKVYKKTGNNGNESDYQLIANVGVNGVDLDIMQGATEEVEGEIGLVPKPVAGNFNRYLASDGTWKTISYCNSVDDATPKSLPYNQHTRLTELTIEEPGVYIIFFRAVVTRITGANVGNNLGLCLVQTQLHVENEGDANVKYTATRPHYIGQNNSFNEYDIARVNNPNAKIYMTIYHNAGGYTIYCGYSSICAIRLDK